MAVIERIKNKDGSVKTNAQMVREAYGIWKDLRDGKGAKNSQEAVKMYKSYMRMFNNDKNIADEVMTWAETIVNAKDDYDAQKLIETTLLPVDFPAQAKE